MKREKEKGQDLDQMLLSVSIATSLQTMAAPFSGHSNTQIVRNTADKSFQTMATSFKYTQQFVRNSASFQTIVTSFADGSNTLNRL